MKKTPMLLLGLLAVALAALPADASRNTSGTYTLPYPAVQSGKVISSTWANGTMADLQTEMTGSLSRDGYGGMRAPLRLYAGTAGVPGLAFVGDTVSGLYLNAGSDVRMSIAGSDVAKWTAAGMTAFSPLTCSSTLAVTGNTTLTGTLTANGAATFASTITANGASTFTAALASQAGLTATNTTANTAAITATGNGTASGVVGTGGASSGAGVKGTGGAPNGYGGVFLGTGTGGGISVIGGGSSSTGAVITGGSPNGYGASIGGAGTGPGMLVSAGTASTSTTRYHAVEVGNGDIAFNSVANPASTTAFTNSLTPSNIVKAWANVTTNGSGGVTVNGGFNINAAVISSGDVVVSFPGGATMNGAYSASVLYGPAPAGFTSPLIPVITSAANGGITIHTVTADNVQASAATKAFTFYLMVVGPQ